MCQSARTKAKRALNIAAAISCLLCACARACAMRASITRPELDLKACDEACMERAQGINAIRNERMATRTRGSCAR